MTIRSSKRLKEYTQSTLGVAAIERAKAFGLKHNPGENVSYIVADEQGRGRQRVRLLHEDIDRLDFGWYEREAIRATESVLSPLGWRREGIEGYLRDDRDVMLEAH